MLLSFVGCGDDTPPRPAEVEALGGGERAAKFPVFVEVIYERSWWPLTGEAPVLRREEARADGLV